MLRQLAGFVKERAGSVISKKVGAALLGEMAVAQGNPELTGLPLVVYIIAQAVLEGWTLYVNRRWPA